jgi:hypothetical protein
MSITLAIGDRVSVDDAAPDSLPGVWKVVRLSDGFAQITPEDEDPESLRLAWVPVDRLVLEPPF